MSKRSKNILKVMIANDQYKFWKNKGPREAISDLRIPLAKQIETKIYLSGIYYSKSYA